MVIPQISVTTNRRRLQGHLDCDEPTRATWEYNFKD